MKGWRQLRMKYLVGINERSLNEDEPASREFQYIDISTVGRGLLVSDPVRTSFGNAPSRARRLVRSGDTIVSTVRTYLRAVWPVCGDAEDLVVSTGFAVLTPHNIDPQFLGWWAQSGPFIEAVVSRSVGVSYPAINASEIGDLYMPVPSSLEQQRIADYLNAETARIDALIAKKRRMINRLEERARFERVHSVLHGLNPVTGEGRVPDGWAVTRLGVLLALHRGFDLPTDTRVEGPVPVISSGGVSGSHSEKTCDGPGVVTGRYGTVGEVFFVEGPYWPLNTTLFVSEFRGNDAKWVYYLLSAMPLDIDSAKSAVTGINRNVIGTLWAPKPPLEVQRSIAKHLDASERCVDQLVNPIRRQIDLLIEHRQALITAAVTGQLQVSEVAA